MLRLRLLTFPLLAVAAAGCGKPALYDCAGKLITYPAMMAPVEGGWVAVDTSGYQIRAVVEIQVPSTDPDVGPTTAPLLQLRVGDGVPLEPGRMRLGNLSCHYMVPERAECRELQDDPKHCVYGAPEERCYYPVRAEFPLEEIPLFEELVVLRVGEATTYVLAWRQDE
jgi:hypothetical protein